MEDIKAELIEDADVEPKSEEIPSHASRSRVKKKRGIIKKIVKKKKRPCPTKFKENLMKSDDTDDEYHPFSTSESEDSDDSYDDKGKQIRRPKDNRVYPMQCDHYGWWQHDPELLKTDWYVTKPRYPLPAAPNTLILDKVRKNNKYASLF